MIRNHNKSNREIIDSEVISETNKIKRLRNVDKLTWWELEALGQGYNISDGHAHQGQNEMSLKIIQNLPEIFLKAEKAKQKTIEHKFEKTFFNFAGQYSYKRLPPPIYQAACSQAIEVIANYLRLTNKSVALLHPTFDNLADILKRHKISMVPLEENAIIRPEITLKELQADAIFLVCPNNPTGFEINQQQYVRIIEYCKKNKKILILDCSFRFYSSLTTWDQYEVPYKSGIDFIVLEDTGKTWPTLELKAGIMVSSKSLYPNLLDISNDFILNVSPFTLALLTKYINQEKKNKSYYGAKKIVEMNRKKLIEICEVLPLTIINPQSPLSVAWIKLPEEWEASVYCKWLKKHDIHIVPGNPFYWDDHARGNVYIRIALLRSEENFIKAINKLRKATLAYNPARN